MPSKTPILPPRKRHRVDVQKIDGGDPDAMVVIVMTKTIKK